VAADHVNANKREASSNHPDRDQQFDYIAVQRATFTAAGLPILSIDSKKKELVGEFKNAGRAWVREPTVVNVHDFPGDALGRAVPYGVYDLTHNRGLIYLGTSGDTAAFASDAIAAWWQTEGRATWSTATISCCWPMQVAATVAVRGHGRNACKCRSAIASG
jgi:hypothetical protein